MVRTPLSLCLLLISYFFPSTVDLDNSLSVFLTSLDTLQFLAEYVSEDFSSIDYLDNVHGFTQDLGLAFDSPTFTGPDIPTPTVIFNPATMLLPPQNVSPSAPSTSNPPSAPSVSKPDVLDIPDDLTMSFLKTHAPVVYDAVYFSCDVFLTNVSILPDRLWKGSSYYESQAKEAMSEVFTEISQEELGMKVPPARPLSSHYYSKLRPTTPGLIKLASVLFFIPE